MDPAGAVAAEPHAVPGPEQRAGAPRNAPVPSPEVSPGLRNPAKVVKKLGFEAVTYGFRSSFRDHAAERTHTPHALQEAALAYVVKNKAEAAYQMPKPAGE